jgi:hypothetical protein
MLPETISPAGAGMSPMMDRAVTLLPQPDSPTTASTSPGRTSKLTPSTAWTVPTSVWKTVLRSSTWSSAPALASTSSGVS